jgi:uncharacterized protein YabN with tetrapyrrole methylase and pyrophosphatase domain
MSDEASRDSSMDIAAAFAALAETMNQLTAEDGCAWHGVQTHQSLVRYLIEESYELVDAIETHAPSDEVKEELGDLLYQVFFHAAIAQRDGEGYSVSDVADALNEKLIARHPHVFSDRGYMSVDELNAQWESLKEDASGRQRGVLEGIVSSMPTLARAEKVIDRLERADLLDALQTDPKTAADIGAELLRIIRVAHANSINADEALRVALRSLIESTPE